MSHRTRSERIVIFIAAITILSGLLQLIAPQTALGTMGVAATPDVTLLFVIVSLFTALFGAALLHAMLSNTGLKVVALWAALQKVIGSSAIGIGVAQGLIASTALLVAGYDFLAGLFVLWYWSRVRQA